MGHRTTRIDYGPLPVVARDHHAAPTLTEEQGQDALRLGRALQESAVSLGPVHARAHADALRRRRVKRLAMLVLVLDIEAGFAVVGQALGWWPN